MQEARSTQELRVLIVAEHASAKFGGEAALPLHYFRVLRKRRVPVWLLTHARTRDELSALYPSDDHIIYIEDTRWHRAMWRIGMRLPARMAYVTTGFLSRLSTQWAQRRVVHRLVAEQRIDVVHQPMPVSPREPSMMFGFGVPVVIGPMNGGMDYPPFFRVYRGRVGRTLLRLARASSTLLNRVIPGKRQAVTLLVANARTREALPQGVCANVVELVENGVDLTLWQASEKDVVRSGNTAPTFAFMGRLVDWKAVDLLLRAFAQARARAPMRLWILGDGPEKQRLERLAAELSLTATASSSSTVSFAGWLDQATCVARMKEADCLVLPSLLECGGAVVLEAMSMGKPVIATAWGGPLDYLDPTCGVLIPPLSHEAIVAGFAQAMVDIAAEPLEAKRLGARGRAKIKSRYDWEIKVDFMLATYRNAILEFKEGSPSNVKV